MKHLIYFLTCIVIFSASCSGLNKRLNKSRKPESEKVTPKAEEKNAPEITTPIKEVEEKLVPNEDGITNHHRYFVIIGSFRNPENSKKHQEQIKKEGFSSEVLKNDEGLYRVSVLATDDINIARDDIRRIRSIFPKYSDTWLLIHVK